MNDCNGTCWMNIACTQNSNLYSLIETSTSIKSFWTSKRYFWGNLSQNNKNQSFYIIFFYFSIFVSKPAFFFLLETDVQHVTSSEKLYKVSCYLPHCEQTGIWIKDILNGCWNSFFGNSTWGLFLKKSSWSFERKKKSKKLNSKRKSAFFRVTKNQ